MTNVLIVDDEETIRFSFESILTDAGYTVMTAATLNEAKNKVDSNDFDVAVIDRLLASDDGLTLAEYIHKTRSFCTTIMISAFPTFKSAAAGFNHDLFAYLQKPVKKDSLCRVIKAAANQTRKKKGFSGLEKQLIQAQKMASVGMQAGSTLHDFNNLFMAIDGFTDMAAKGGSSEHIEKIRQISQQGKKLSGDFLGFLTQTSQEPVCVSVKSLIKDALALLRIMIPKTVCIREHSSHTDAFVRVHPNRIEQVFVNLGINAVHAMKGQTGLIDVSFKPILLDTTLMRHLQIDTPDCIKLEFKDTGCGMDTATLQQIFTPFFSSKPAGFGTGLGLTTARKIITDHAGAITADSTQGQGSLFNIYLPAIRIETNDSYVSPFFENQNTI